MNKIISYICLLSLSFLLGDRYLIQPVFGQNLPPTESLKFNPPDNGAPGGNRSESGSTGSRDDCPNVEKHITAFIPPTNWGNTLAERPTLWFYIPYPQGRLTLILRDEETANSVPRINRISYDIDNGGGIMGFPIPETVPALEVNHAYRWRVYFNCKPNIQPSPTGIQGVVQRVAKNEAFTAQLTANTPIQERINLYANQGLWYEAITTLIAFRRAQPTDQQLNQIWSDLLSHPDVELAEFISQPLVDCCQNVIAE